MRSRRREVYMRRQAMLLIFIACVIMALVWLVQSVYQILPAGHTVLAEQETVQGVNGFSHSLAVWQGNKGKPIAMEEQAILASHQPDVSGKTYSGIGRMLYCLQEVNQSGTDQNVQDCLQLREELAKQQNGAGTGSTDGANGIGEATDGDGANGTGEATNKDGDNGAGNETNGNGGKDANETGAANGSGKDDDKNKGKGETKEPEYAGTVYLTFDDGPSKITPSVLEVLKQAGIKATFFTLGQQVNRYPELAQQIVAEGHSIGNHSYNHRYDELYKSPQTFIDQVLNTTKAIYNATGEFTPLFRAPGGSYSNLDESYMKALTNAGYIVFDWNVDSGDSTSKTITSKEIIANVKAAKLKDRMVVLMHDSSTHQTTLDALPEIIKYFKNANYQFAAITGETEPITSPIAKSIKWQRTALTDKQAQSLKTQTELLQGKAEEQKLASS